VTGVLLGCNHRQGLRDTLKQKITKQGYEIWCLNKIFREGQYSNNLVLNITTAIHCVLENSKILSWVFLMPLLTYKTSK
jgi:hypothetical protein